MISTTALEIAHTARDRQPLLNLERDNDDGEGNFEVALARQEAFED